MSFHVIHVMLRCPVCNTALRVVSTNYPGTMYQCLDWKCHKFFRLTLGEVQNDQEPKK